MNDRKKPEFVTRGELYPILGSIYTLIGMVLLGLVRDEQNVLLVIGYFIMFAGVMVLSFTYLIVGIWERRRRTRESRDFAEPDSAADRPRE